MRFFGAAAMVMATVGLFAAVALFIRGGSSVIPAVLWTVLAIALFVVGVRALRQAREH
jgi:hypothetical protein